MTFPARPFPAPPAVWLSADPAGAQSAKPSLGVIWHGAEAVRFVALRVGEPGWSTVCMPPPSLLVVESGYVGKGKAASLKLERARSMLEGWVVGAGSPCVRVSPDQWRAVLRVPARGKAAILRGQREICRQLPRTLPGGSMPRVELARGASNDDKRASLLIGVACVVAWRWT